jgi:hypothetical protein
MEIGYAEHRHRKFGGAINMDAIAQELVNWLAIAVDREMVIRKGKRSIVAYPVSVDPNTASRLRRLATIRTRLALTKVEDDGYGPPLIQRLFNRWQSAHSRGRVCAISQ